MGIRADRKQKREELRKKIYEILLQITNGWLNDVAASRIPGDTDILIRRRYDALCKQLPEIFPSKLRDAMIGGIVRKIVEEIDKPIVIAIKNLNEKLKNKNLK